MTQARRVSRLTIVAQFVSTRLCAVGLAALVFAMGRASSVEAGPTL
jgi:hypothetical protein